MVDDLLAFLGDADQASAKDLRLTRDNVNALIMVSTVTAVLYDMTHTCPKNLMLLQILILPYIFLSSSCKTSLFWI